MLGGGELTKGDSEVVGIVESVEKILVERMNILQAGKAVEDGAKFLRKGLLGELDLSSVESCKAKEWLVKVAAHKNCHVAFFVWSNAHLEYD